MFTRAGFNPKHRDTGIRARAYVIGAPGDAGAARLLRMQCGDLAWHVKNRNLEYLVWGSRVQIVSLIHPRGCYGHAYTRLPR